jgi:CheY-like chemotaxis protein
MVAHDYILVVDDDDAIRESVVEALEDASYPVKAAHDGREALSILRQGEGRPCLVLLDLMMPGMDGWEFAREQSQDPALAGVPVCVITAVGTGRALPSDAVAVVRKPFKLKELLDVVHQYC